MHDSITSENRMAVVENLTLYHSASSPNSTRVRIFLAEKGLSISLVVIDLGKGEQHSEAYRAINPVLVHLRASDRIAPFERSPR